MHVFSACLKSIVLIQNMFIRTQSCERTFHWHVCEVAHRGEKKRILPPPPLSPSHQVRKTSEHSPLPATFAHCPHSSPETQYLTIDKQLTHLFFLGNPMTCTELHAACGSQHESQLRRRRTDNFVVKAQTLIKLYCFPIRNTDW